ncbi:hypothetical protein ACFX11_030596 [Malus domestica]
MINYMVITAHFLDTNWGLHKRILNFVQVTSHKGDDIGRCLEVCLNDWGIDKVFSITVDNASANDTAIAYMKRKLKSNGTLLLDGAHLHMRCACHILNLIVKDGMTELSCEIEAIRNCVKFIHSSPARLEYFREYCVLLRFDRMSSIPFDVVTRWNATYEMLNSAFKFKEVFSKMAFECDSFIAYFKEEVSKEVDGVTRKAKRVGPPEVDDWERSMSFAHFLKKFYDATLKLSATLTPTSHLILSTVIALQVEIQEQISNASNATLQSLTYEGFNLLDWWKGHCAQYPTLSKVSKDVLALPSSTVASENAFSLGGRVVDPFRTSLTPKTVEALVCTSDWLRGKEFCFYKEPTLDEFHFYQELERLERSMANLGGEENTTQENEMPPPPPRPPQVQVQQRQNQSLPPRPSIVRGRAQPSTLRGRAQVPTRREQPQASIRSRGRRCQQSS